MESNSDHKNFGTKGGKILKLKSIKQARVLNQFQKKRKMMSVSLTDKEFEKQLSELKQYNLNEINKKFDTDALKSEIQNAASQALKSIHCISHSKDSWNLKSFRNIGMKNLYSASNSPLVTERACQCTSANQSFSFHQSTPKVKNGKIPLNESRNKNFNFVENTDFKENLEFTSSNTTKEHQFIDKVKQATQKLREMRKKFSVFH